MFQLTFLSCLYWHVSPGFTGSKRHALKKSYKRNTNSTFSPTFRFWWRLIFWGIGGRFGWGTVGGIKVSKQVESCWTSITHRTRDKNSRRREKRTITNESMDLTAKKSVKNRMIKTKVVCTLQGLFCWDVHVKHWAILKWNYKKPPFQFSM